MTSPAGSNSSNDCIFVPASVGTTLASTQPTHITASSDDSDDTTPIGLIIGCGAGGLVFVGGLVKLVLHLSARSQKAIIATPVGPVAAAADANVKGNAAAINL